MASGALICQPHFLRSRFSRRLLKADDRRLAASLLQCAQVAVRLTRQMTTGHVFSRVLRAIDERARIDRRSCCHIAVVYTLHRELSTAFSHFPASPGLFRIPGPRRINCPSAVDYYQPLIIRRPAL